MSMQQAIGNPNPGGFSAAAYQQQQQELQKKRQTMPESVSEMLRKRQMQKMRGSENAGGQPQHMGNMGGQGQYKRY